MDRVTTIALLSCLAILYRFRRWYTRSSIAQIPGPEPESFLLGNYREFVQSLAAEAELKWQAQFGDIVRLKGPLGADRLLVSDPKAIQYIYQTSGYNFEKQPERVEFARVVSGRGIVWAEGETHKRHRKIMLPGFSTTTVREATPVFFAYASKLAGQWRDVISASADQTGVFNIPRGISRAALDAIGKVAFDYEFGTLDHADNPLGNAYANLVFDTFGVQTKGQILVRDLMGYLPHFLRVLITDHAPNPKLEHARSTARLGTKVAKGLVESKSAALLRGKENKDIMSLLVKANASENEKFRLNEEELLSQMRTITSAGHETTANALTWMLLELARNPQMQAKLRREIRSMQQTIRSRGDPEFSLADLDSMAYLNAFIKEGLRFHPVVSAIYRQSVKDDVLPLSKPVVTTAGETLTALPIPKGLKIITSISAYNRIQDIFGADSHTFDPERWLDRRVKKSTTVGVIGNLMSFSGGVRSCIGWKFAVAEMQAFLIELVGSFVFELTPEAQTVRRESSVVMVPTIPGELEKGAQLPLRLRVAPQEDSVDF